MRANADAWLAAFHRLEAEAVAAGDDPGAPEVLRGLIERADDEVPALPLLRYWETVFRNPWNYGLAALAILLTVAVLSRRRSLATRRERARLT